VGRSSVHGIIYSTSRREPSDRVREQLRLWSASRILGRRGPSLAAGGYEEKLDALLKEDLSFKGENTTYSRHNFHAFAAMT